MMKTSLKGILEIAEHEGIVPTVYLDSVGVKTFGVGHTAGAGYPLPHKMSLAMPDGEALESAIDLAVQVFQKDLGTYERRVNEAIHVPLKQYEFDALVSFDFNTGGIFRAQLTKAINRGDKAAAAKFLGWLKPPEIEGRRRAEMALFKTGNYDANGDSIPVWSTNGNGKLLRVHSVMSGKELFKRLKKLDGSKRPSGRPSLTKLINDFFAAIIAAFGGKK